MHPFETSQHRRGWLAPAAALLMLALWTALLGLAASERLHHALHADAGQANHECLIVAFAKAQLLGASAEIGVVVAVAALVVFLSSFVPTLRARLDRSLAQSRGPPLVVVRW